MSEPKITKEILHVIQFYGGRVIPADVSANTGLSGEETIRQLNKLALIMNAGLEVNAKGEIVYYFSNTNWYIASKWQALELIGKKLSKAISQLFWWFHFSCRKILQALIWFSPIPTALILCLLFGYLSRGITFGSRAFVLVMVAVLYLVGCVIQKSFLADCVSFIVGPRNIKNYDMWHNMAEFIREHGGVVISEQLAQITGSDDRHRNNVFPILVRFDGRPIVSETGNILYTFPALLLTADNKVREGGQGSPGEEPRYEFADIPDERVGYVRWYVIINLIAFTALFCFTYFPNILYWTGQLYWIKMLEYYYLIFVTIFGIYPLCRAIIIYLLNLPIDRRNYLRLTALGKVPLAMLDEAYAYQKQLIDIGHEKIMYRTDKDTLEQQFDD